MQALHLPPILHLPPLEEITATARVVSIPLRYRFRDIMVREAMVWQGPQGWAEFSPFIEYDDTEASVWLSAAIDFAWNPQPQPVRDTVWVNATVPAVPVNAVRTVLAAFPGCRTAKVKVAEKGGSLADDVARIREVRAVLGPEGRIRVDANGQWTVDEAEHAIHALAQWDLEYVEQPCATIDELEEIRQRISYMGIPIAADESVRKVSDPLEVVRRGAADILVVKVQPLGGVRRVCDVVSQIGLPVTVSSALETSVGISMGAHCAASIPHKGYEGYDCGLGTVSLLTGDLCEESLVAVDGKISVHRVTPSPKKLEEYEASPDRVRWWRARLERCYRLLADQKMVCPAVGSNFRGRSITGR